MESSLESLKTEPPTNDVEICCRFEDIATEGHACFARKEYSEARDCYVALVSLASQLTRQSPLMKSTSHFFVSMACNSLADSFLANCQTEEAQKMSVEADLNSQTATRSLDYGDARCPLQDLDKQLLEDYEIFERKPSFESMLIRSKHQTSNMDDGDDGGPVVEDATSSTSDAGVSTTTTSSKSKKKKKKGKGKGSITTSAGDSDSTNNSNNVNNNTNNATDTNSDDHSNNNHNGSGNNTNNSTMGNSSNNTNTNPTNLSSNSNSKSKQSKQPKSSKGDGADSSNAG